MSLGPMKSRSELSQRLGLPILLIAICIGCSGEDGSEASQTRSLVGVVPTHSDVATGTNEAPNVDHVKISPAKPAPGRVVEAIVQLSDPNGDRLSATYEWRTAQGRKLGTGKSFDTRGLREGASLQLVVTASDGKLNSSERVLRFRLSEASTEIAMLVIDTSKGTGPGSQLTALIESTNPRSNHLDAELSWRVNGQPVSDEDFLDTSSYSPGDIVTVRAYIRTGQRRSRAVLSPPVTLARADAPEIVSLPTAGIRNGAFQYQIRVKVSPANSQLRYEKLRGPEAMKVDPKSGLVTWRPTPEDSGSVEIEVAVKDESGSGSAQSFTIQIDSPATSPASPR